MDTVEIDPRVVNAGFAHLNHDHDPALEPLIQSKWRLNIDDAKHFLKNTPKKFDLIVMDIEGIISVSLNGEVAHHGTVAMRILQTLKSVFDDFLVVAPYDESNFAYASQELPFGKAGLEAELKRRQTFKTRVFDESEIAEGLSSGDYPVITQKKMDLVLKRTWKRLLTQYFNYDD